jgi:hypothetical protein
VSRIPRDPRPPRSLRRDGDGTLYDLDERRTITVVELAEEVRVGRRFRARQQGSERDCTQQVLLVVLGCSAIPAPPLSPAAGSQLGALAGAIGAIAGAIADRRADDHSGAGASGSAANGRTESVRGRSSNGTTRRLRPSLEIDDEEE